MLVGRVLVVLSQRAVGTGGWQECLNCIGTSESEVVAIIGLTSDNDVVVEDLGEMFLQKATVVVSVTFLTIPYLSESKEGALSRRFGGRVRSLRGRMRGLGGGISCAV